MVIIKKKWKLLETINDDGVRFFACKLEVRGTEISLICVYASNNEADRKELWTTLNELEWNVPGDWNFVEVLFACDQWNDLKSNHDLIDMSQI